MDNSHTLSTPMVVRSLDINTDAFRPQDNDEKPLGDEIPYISAIGALMYLAKSTRPEICFVVGLLARFSSSPTKRHWNDAKHILQYLRGTMNMSLFYFNEFKSELIDYADAGYLYDLHKAGS